jgi:hypothetical protein
MYANCEEKAKIGENIPKITSSKKENNFNDFYHSLKKVLDTYPYADHDPFYSHI